MWRIIERNITCLLQNMDLVLRSIEGTRNNPTENLYSHTIHRSQNSNPGNANTQQNINNKTNVPNIINQITTGSHNQNNSHNRADFENFNSQNINNNNHLLTDINSYPLFMSSNFHFKANANNIPCDKITSIIQNWNLRFDGSSTGLNVDEFLYRVRSLT